MTIPSAPSSTDSGEPVPDEPPRPRLVVGLGNPGPDYVGTRHNVGFELIDRLAAQKRVSLGTLRCRSRVGMGAVDGIPLFLAKPLTFMNLSGEAVTLLAKSGRVALEDILVLVDDIHLAPGRLRLRARGSDGGQNGLKSIIASLGTDRFARLRIGVGEPSGKSQVDWVLSRFGDSDRGLVDEALVRAEEVVDLWLREGVAAAMNRCNAPESS